MSESSSVLRAACEQLIAEIGLVPTSDRIRLQIEAFARRQRQEGMERVFSQLSVDLVDMLRADIARADAEGTGGGAPSEPEETT